VGPNDDDGTDDFDFITGDGNRLKFTALDRETRTDTWLSNKREIELGTDPWDPDTDDDGLTDGQEEKWVTKPLVLDSGLQVDESIPNTDSLNPDTDNDGYWDGWVGVYDVGRTDNVVLYVEHLSEDDQRGLEPDERVDKQIRLHEVDQNGANLTGEDGLQHSSLHIGELTWGTDPASQDDTPSPSITIEVDYYADTEFDTIADDTWADGIEKNYALYGINVEIIQDEVINNSQTEWAFMGVNPDDGFGVAEINTVAEQYNNRDSDEYVLVANEGDGMISDTQTGVNIRGFPYQAIFIRGNQNVANRIPDS